MSRFLTIGAIAAGYFVFAILLNSVGTVILQSINSFDISKPEAATLEGFKDLSIALVSFLVASFLPRLGYKLAMLIALVAVSLVCLITPSLADFLAIKILFACIGSAFALVKVSVYAIIGQLSHDARSHSALLNTIEGIFMIGVLSGYWIFSAFIDPQQPASLSWLNVYYWLAGICLFAALIVMQAPIQKPELDPAHVNAWQDFVDMLKLTYQPLVLIFVLSIFLYVLIEQGIGTWLPTFNREVLKLPVDISVQITSVFAASLAIGRLLAGQLLKFVPWYLFLNICLACMAALILLSLPMTENIPEREVSHILNAPLAAFLLPLIGLMMAPLYPILNSVMLSALDRSRQAAMTGLIVVFSALGGTTGSILTGFLFDAFGGQNAFYTSLVPIAGIAVCLFAFRLVSRHQSMGLTRGHA